MPRFITNHLRALFFEVSIFFLIISISVQGDNFKQDKNSKDYIPDSIQRAWEVSWSRFYRSDTHLFYDYITSYEEGKGLDHLPKAFEVTKQFPNAYGYGTGMEDCMISAGVMLSMMVDRYVVTQEEFLQKRAYEVFQGIELSATAHGHKGFLARGVCQTRLR